MDSNDVKRLEDICDDPFAQLLHRVDAWCELAQVFDDSANKTYAPPYMKEKVRECINSIRRLLAER